jgi:hypothetical protein
MMATMLGALVKHAFRAVCVIVVVSSIAACMPKIMAFQADPQQLCMGQSTTLSWKVRGEAMLSAQPPLAGVGPVDSVGSYMFAPVETTMFAMTATHQGQEAFAKQEVVVRAMESQQPIVLRTRPESPDGLVAVETLPPADWDDLLRIDTIAGQSGRPLRIVHEGRDVLLAADGSASDQLRGTKVSGRWEIHAGLLPGEVIGDPAHAPPDRLRLRAHLSCTH